MNPCEQVYQAMAEQGIKASLQEPLSRWTTFQIGGPAALFCVPNSSEQLVQAAALCREAGLRIYWLGKGSNVLFSDEGFDGAVILVSEGIGEVHAEGNVLHAGAGASMERVCLCALDHGLTGLEFAYGIPGSVGGAVYMNAGAYGGEIKDVLKCASFLDEHGEVKTLPASELALGYRTSIFETHPWCILSAEFALAPGNKKAIVAQMETLAQKRQEKQPLEMPSAGSTFKRPQGAFAGALIEQCGLRGFAVGGAAISQKHCGFVVNTGGATCQDVVNLTDRVIEIVKKQTGYTLEREIRVVK